MPTALTSPKTSRPQNLFRSEDLGLQRAFFAARPHLRPTPLRSCDALAKHLGVGEVLLKDETARFGLNAFKAAGALFAVNTLVERGEIRAGEIIACASEGNHGRAVARAAREVGCGARVYMSRAVAQSRVEAIESEGANVTLVDGTYDDAVRTLARESTANGWHVVSDTSWPGYSTIPWLIMLGYTRLVDEIAQQTPGAVNAIFVPAGVGGLLAAVACAIDLRYGAAPHRPKVVSVEPVSAACVQASVRAGHPAPLPGPFMTTMGGLRCGEISPMVFPAVHSLVDAFVAIEDEFAFAAMRRLARPIPPDPPVEAGPSGAASVGALLAVLTERSLAELRDALALSPDARIVALVTEGVTEPGLFADVLARH